MKYKNEIMINLIKINKGQHFENNNLCISRLQILF
jgi:hypothetical protein